MSEFLHGLIPREDYWITPLFALAGIFCFVTIVIIALAVWIRFIVWSVDQLTWWAS